MPLHAAVRSLLGSSLARRSGHVIAAVGFTSTCALAFGAELPAELLQPPCVACQQPTGVTPELFSAADWRRLERGEVVIVERSPEPTRGEGDRSVLRESEAAVLVPRPATEVWAVLADFESRPKVFSNVRESHIERVDNNRAWIRQSVEIFWTKIQYTLIATLEPARGLITFVLDRSSPHDIRDTAGSWQVLRHGAASTLLLSRDRIDTGRPVPGTIQSYLVQRSLSQMMSSLRQEVQRRAGNGSVVR